MLLSYMNQAREFYDPQEAFSYAMSLYDQAREAMHTCLNKCRKGVKANATWFTHIVYPYIGIDLNSTVIKNAGIKSFVEDPGVYGTTLTRFDVLGHYYKEQIAQLMNVYKVPCYVGRSHRQIPLPYLFSNIDASIKDSIKDFPMPDLLYTHDYVANSAMVGDKSVCPLSLFSSERVDFSLERLYHYSGTHPRFFQKFILLTNYQWYIDAFIDYGKKSI